MDKFTNEETKRIIDQEILQYNEKKNTTANVYYATEQRACIKALQHLRVILWGEQLNLNS